ncbi:MAG: L-aspartate oxidase [Gemmataceae bacterium]
MSFPKRYLVRFGPKQTQHLFTDLLVIGGGIAGLRAALSVPAHLRVLVVTKDKIRESNSTYAQGGIAAVRDPEDRYEDHIADTITAGAGLCNREVVEVVVREASRAVDDLIRYGARFDDDLGMEGGHSTKRIVHALGDATGAEVMRAIIAAARRASNVTLWDRTFTLDLLTLPADEGGQCVGAMVQKHPRERLLIWAKQTILASGGAGMVYRETTNPPVATADGMAAAYRAGAILRDMEFMQFHPTVLYVAGSSRYLITEAARGLGAYLRDVNGHRFMPEIDPRAELATRDVVSQAIMRTMERTQHPNVYLDLSHLDPQVERSHLPGIDRVCREFDLDITRDPIPVRPGAHYMIGGVKVDAQGRTSIPGLWAAGEVASSGLHGANRLASNSLLEGLVYGAICGRLASEAAEKLPDTFRVPRVEANFSPETDGQLDIADLTASLRGLMMRRVGVQREATGLQEAEKQVAFWCGYVLSREFSHRAGWELQNMLTAARLMIWAARTREESRGVHFRSDFPHRDDIHWQRHLECPSSLPDPPRRVRR